MIIVSINVSREYSLGQWAGEGKCLEKEGGFRPGVESFSGNFNVGGTAGTLEWWVMKIVNNGGFIVLDDLWEPPLL